MFRVLLAEDDTELRKLFTRVLARNGYEVIEATDGKEALDLMEKENVDIIISDIMMPRMSGYELAESLRDAGYTLPILMITAAEGFANMKRGFSAGTDDYMVKPVNLDELLLRVSALLRRARMISERRETMGSTVIDYDSMTVSWEGVTLELPQKEFQLLYKLVSYPGHIFTRQQLMDDVWGIDSETDPHTVEVHIGRIRDKLKENPDIEIVTMRGVGYKAVRRK